MKKNGEKFFSEEDLRTKFDHAEFDKSSFDSDIDNLNKEIDAIEKTVEIEVGVEEHDLNIEEVLPKIEQICNDITKVTQIVRSSMQIPVPNNVPQDSCTPDFRGYSEFADVEVALIALLKQQVKALNNIFDRL